MGIYIFTWKKLKEYLINDEANEQSSNDFGKDIIPAMLNNGEKLVSCYSAAVGARYRLARL